MDHLDELIQTHPRLMRGQGPAIPGYRSRGAVLHP